MTVVIPADLSCSLVHKQACLRVRRQALGREHELDQPVRVHAVHRREQLACGAQLLRDPRTDVFHEERIAQTSRDLFESQALITRISCVTSTQGLPVASPGDSMIRISMKRAAKVLCQSMSRHSSCQTQGYAQSGCLHLVRRPCSSERASPSANTQPLRMFSRARGVPNQMQSS